jgi:predicted AlkP superfamily pyrophosphatase or phosphodiesterase
MSHLHRRTAIAGACAVVAAAGLLPLTTAQAHSQDRRAEKATASHVLLLSVDGLHQSDLASYVHAHPTSALARLVDRGTSYTHALTPVPSDSFPGMVAQVTGGNPGTTGIYYDDSYNPSNSSWTNCATSCRSGSTEGWPERESAGWKLAME